MTFLERLLLIMVWGHMVGMWMETRTERWAQVLGYAAALTPAILITLHSYR